MRRAVLVLMLALSWCFLELATSAQQPAKPPLLPPINPAIAKLDQTIGGLDGPGFSMAYNQASDILAAGCERGSIQAWKKDVLLGIRTGSGTADSLRGHDGAVIALAWEGGPTLASAGSDRKILFWNMAEGKVVHSNVSETLVRSLAMSPDGRFVAAGGEDGLIQLWEVLAGKPTAKLKESTEWVLCLAFSPDGKQLAAGYFDGSIRAWDVAGGKKVADLPAKPNPPPKEPLQPTPTHCLAYSPDGKILAQGRGDGTIQLLNVADGKVLRTCAGHTSAVTGVAFHAGGKVLASSSKDRTVRLWNVDNAQTIKVLEGHGAWVEGVAFVAQGTRLASVGADQTVRVWDLAEPGKK